MPKSIYRTEGNRKKYNITLPQSHKNRDLALALFRLSEQQMARVKPEETNRMGQIFPWILKNGPAAGEEKKLYETTIRLPFENTTIPVPAYYNQMLTKKYGNYCVFKKGGGAHNYPFFAEQKRVWSNL